MTSDDQDVRARAMTEAGAVARGRSVPGDPAAVAAEALADGALPDGAPAVDALPDGALAAEAVTDGALADGALADGVSGALGTSAAPARDRRRSFWRELPVLVVVALVIALVIKTFVMQAFFIPSASMEDTLRIGDKVLVNKLVYHFRKIEPGDVVVFNGAGSWDPVPGPAKASPDPAVRLYDATLGRLLHSISGLFGTVPGQTDYIKRVIGVPGDRVACCTAGGLVTVNGVPLHEKSYLYPGNAPGDTPQGFSRHFDITVPPGRLWVMGDYRAVSEDSRLRAGDPGQGTIPESQVIGRAFLIVWPPGRWRVLPIPSTFSQPGVGRPDAAASGAAASVAAASVAAAASSGPADAAAAPSSPLLPLAAGLAGAIPVTWLQRRLRRRPSRRRR